MMALLSAEAAAARRDELLRAAGLEAAYEKVSREWQAESDRYWRLVAVGQNFAEDTIRYRRAFKCYFDVLDAAGVWREAVPPKEKT